MGTDAAPKTITLFERPGENQFLKNGSKLEKKGKGPGLVRKKHDKPS